MAKIKELNEEWHAWIKTRPEAIQKMAKELPPDRLYWLETSGHRVEIYGYVEDGTLIVSVLGKWNKTMFERNVFGIKPEDLVECDLPSPDEELGAILTEKEDIDAYLQTLKEENNGS
jgi:hypothetical protein